MTPVADTRSNMTWLGFIVRNIGRRPGRAGFTVLGVALAIASFVTLTGLTRGLVQGAAASHDERGVDLVATHRGMFFHGSLPESLAESIRGIHGVAGVATELAALVHFENARAVVAGWRVSEFTFREMKLLRGRLPKPGEAEVVLGDILAEARGAKLGTKVRLNYRPFAVVGIASYSNSMLRRGAFMDLAEFQRLMSRPGQATMFQVRLDKPRDAAAREKVQAEIASLRPEVFVSTTGQALRSSRLIQLIDLTSLAISIVALAIGCLSVLNTMAMAVEERTREIGILASIGWDKRAILALLLSEGLVLSGAGGLLGIALGLIGHEALIALLTPGASMSVATMIEQGIRALGIALVVGAIGALVPAWRAASLTPAAALRRQ